MRPLGVVSKNVIGDLKMANAILSCSLRDACISPPTRVSHGRSEPFGASLKNLLTSIEQKIHKISV